MAQAIFINQLTTLPVRLHGQAPQSDGAGMPA